MRSQVKLILALFIISIALQFGPVVLDKGLQIPIRLNRVSRELWEAQVSQLPKGEYYFSGGRPLGVCEVSANAQLIDSNNSGVGDLRSHLFLGGAVFVSDKTVMPILLSLQCKKQEGFPVTFYEPPSLSKYHIGIVLQLLRNIFQNLLGVICSLFLLVSLGLGVSKNRTKFRVTFHFFLFAFSALFYSISVAHFTSFFLAGGPFTCLHIILRIIFSGTFVALCENYSSKRIWLSFGYIVLTTVAVVLSISNIGLALKFYDYIFPIFFISTGLAAYDLLSSKQNVPFVRSLGGLAFVWTLFQIRDNFVYWYSDGGAFSGPTLIAVLTGALTYFRYQEDLSQISEQAQLEATLEAHGAISSFAGQLAHDIRSPLAFLKVLYDESTFPVGLREVLGNVLTRLDGIVTQLLTRNLQVLKTPNSVDWDIFRPSQETFTSLDLVGLLYSLIAEKKYSDLDRRGTKIALQVLERDRGRKVAVQQTELQRIISNLLDNALHIDVAASEITVRVEVESEKIQIYIEDNGIGIPTEVVKRLGLPGNTLGKLGGSGLGLFHAKKTIEFWGGSFQILTSASTGAKVVISLMH